MARYGVDPNLVQIRLKSHGPVVVEVRVTGLDKIGHGEDCHLRSLRSDCDGVG